MIVIKPIDIADSILTSTVAEPDVAKGEVVWTDDLNSAKYTPSTVDSYGLASDGVEDYSLIFNSGWYIENYTSGSLTSTSSMLTVVNSLQDLAFFSGGVFATDRTSVRRWDAVGDTDKIVNISGGTEAGTSFTGLTQSGGRFFLYDKTHTKVRVYDYDGDQTLTHSGTDYVVDLGENPKLTTTDDDGFVVLIGNVSYFYSNQFTLLSSTIMDFPATSDVRLNGIARGGSSYNIINKSQSLVKNYDLNLIFNGLYRVGDQAIKTETHKIYQAAANTDDDPEVGVNLTVPTWIEVAPTNKYAMFDFTISSVTDGPTPLVVDLDVETYATGIAGFNINGADNINVTVVSDAAGEVYNTDIDMNDNSAVIDAWTYYFEPIVKRDRFILLDLPPYVDATITVTFTGVGDITVGALVTGPQIQIGVANYNTEIQLLDFSTQARDQFGNFEIVKRSTADLVKFDVSIQKNKVPYVRRQFQELAQVPAVWVGEGGDIDDPTAVFGYYEKYTNNISSPSITKSTITIQGLV